MRFTAPLIALAASLPLLTTAQMGPDDTICGFLYGTDYTDACCHTVISRGVNAPCTDIEYVSNLTECSTYHYPTGWSVCVEKVRTSPLIPRNPGRAEKRGEESDGFDVNDSARNPPIPHLALSSATGPVASCLST